MICTGCGCQKECRPYGVNGAMICFDCGFSTPEVKANTEAMYGMQLDAAARSDGVVLIGLEAGPVPATTELIAAIAQGKGE